MTKEHYEKMKKALEEIANDLEFMPFGLDENDSCIMCGFNHKRMADFAKEALQSTDA